MGLDNLTKGTPAKPIESRYIQRLKKPQGTGEMDKLIKSLSFGGGLVNGGLSDSVMGMLQDIFSFDYMGAAEFEFGSVPSALQHIASNIDGYTTHRLKGDDGIVFVICHEKHIPHTTDLISRLRNGEEKDLKERSRLQESLQAIKEKAKNNYYYSFGWLELDNGFLFFTDKKMFLATSKLFGINV